jgi:hypothetical protein
MKGIYLTEEGKKEIEAKIAELESSYREYADWEGKLGELKMLKEILSSATILPVEDNWDIILKLYLME